jgi:hypothetical protein
MSAIGGDAHAGTGRMALDGRDPPASRRGRCAWRPDARVACRARRRPVHAREAGDVPPEQKSPPSPVSTGARTPGSSQAAESSASANASPQRHRQRVAALGIGQGQDGDGTAKLRIRVGCRRWRVGVCVGAGSATAVSRQNAAR